MSLFPSAYKEDDPFNVWMKRAAPIAVLVLLPLVILLQQLTSSFHSQTTNAPMAEVVRSEDVPDPGVADLTVTSKMLVKQVFHVLHRNDPSGKSSRQPWGDIEHPDRWDGIAVPREVAREAITDIDRLAVSRTDRFRAAIVAGELLGPAETAQRLQKLSEEASPGGDLARDIGWLKPWYENAAKGRLEPLPAEVQESLRSRHEWFADLALSHQQPAGEPLRWATMTGAGKLSTLRTLINLWEWVGLFLGVVLAVILLLKMRGHSHGIPVTTVPRHVYAEAFALFLLGFVTMDCVGLLLLGETAAWAFVVHELMLWTAVLAVFCPLLRGVTAEELRVDIGLTAGEDGIGREISAGLVGYFAGVALLFGYYLLLGMFTGDAGEDPATDTRFPMFEQPLSNSWIPVIFGAISACIWAPVFEEIFFRGCLHRAFPTKLPLVARVLSSAVIFGIVHPYGTQGIIQVALGGLVYGYLREWRGSIIGPMLAHALHNGTITAVQIGVLVAIK
ncbi:MAG TPA: CPBP family glutamic-type intramembrane protease [Phycisphaerales bacterium]|nr:CPBP family glutamic-type intramembrane protease [Phycisphaerales bacterium]